MIKNLRLSKGWSQEQLAQFSGLSVRTIQRIERGHSAGLESLKCVAAVLDVEVSRLNSFVKKDHNDFLGAHPILYVLNITESADFFVKKLRFEKGELSKNNQSITVFRDQTVLKLKMSNHDIIGSSSCVIIVKDIKAIYAEFSGRKINIIENFVNETGQLVEFHIQDNNGNTLTFKQNLVNK